MTRSTLGYSILNEDGSVAEHFSSAAALAKHYGLGIARMQKIIWVHQAREIRTVSSALNEKLVELAWTIPDDSKRNQNRGRGL